MELTCQWMGVGPNRYKFLGLLLVLALFSCENRFASDVTSEGLHLKDDQVFVSELLLDSIDFATGETLWFFNGSINVDGKELPYQVFFEKNPLYSDPKAIRSKAPKVFKSDSLPYCVVTEKYGTFEISWRCKKQFLHLKTTAISEH